MAQPVKRRRRRGYTRLSRKNQATIPIAVLAEAGVEPGDELRASAVGPGRIVLEREASRLDEFEGALTGVFGDRFLDRLRDEWDSSSSTPAS